MSKRLITSKPFDFSARVTMQLGRESISSSTVAVSELIKNSFDADAENVTLDFYLRDKGISTLVIKDDGAGMNYSLLTENWLKIGTNNKAISGFSSKKRRVLTGAKGLGRLGIDRLCKKLILYTKEKGSEHITQLVVDWRSYENTDKTLSQIKHDLFEIETPLKDKYGEIFEKADDHGTYLVMVGLRDSWSEEFIETLNNELRLLISPYRSTNDFSIKLNTIKKGLTSQIIIDSQDILSAATWKISAKVDSNARVTTVFTNNDTGEEVKHPPIVWKDWIKNKGELPLFGPLQLDFHYLVRNKESLSKVNLSATNWSSFMDLNRGIRIYRDDFRVRPYGEPTGKGDWLDLGVRKAQSPGGIVQGGWRIGPHQVIGAVRISRTTNAILDDQANREGIVENDAFFQMRSFALKVIETFEELAHKSAAGTETTDLSKLLENILNKASVEVDNAFESVKQIAFVKKKRSGKKKIPPAKLMYQRIRELERAKVKHEEALFEYYDVLKKERIKLIDEKDTLSNLASIGILTICFGHEIRTQAALALENADELIELVHDAIKQPSNIDVSELDNIGKMVKDSIGYVNNFSKLALNNIKPDKRIRKKINVPLVFGYIFSVMTSSLNKMGIKYSIEYEKIDRQDFNVRSFEIDWESIAINLITNSMWALNDISRENREIKVLFSRLGGTKLQLSFEDSGCGLETNQEEAIFLPMKSNKRDRTGNVIGTGMGLAIVHTQVTQHMGGHITAKTNSSLGGAGFYIEINQDR